MRPVRACDAARMRLLLGVLVLSVVACCPKDPRDACEPNPEPRIAKRGVRPRGVPMNGMGLNGTRPINGTFLGGNGAFLTNGTALDGVAVGGGELRNMTINVPRLVDGAENELVATTADGKPLGGAALVGAKLFGLNADGKTFEVVVSTYEREGDIAYYRVTENGENACPDGGRGMFVPGVWDARAQQAPSRTAGGHTATTSFSCMDGAIAKCVAWGWAPWKASADVHQACTRMVRADYCGTGISFTRNGVPIWSWDGKGPDDRPADQLFEAGWGRDGAKCVQRTRFDATRDGAAVFPSCWSSIPRCGSTADALQAGALVVNTSPRAARRFCSQD